MRRVDAWLNEMSLPLALGHRYRGSSPSPDHAGMIGPRVRCQAINACGCSLNVVKIQLVNALDRISAWRDYWVREMKRGGSCALTEDISAW